jgi:hypothetical protein
MIDRSKHTSGWLKLVALLVSVAGAVLLYGYWNASTRGVVYLDLNDVSAKQVFGSAKQGAVSTNQNSGRILHAKLRLKDAAHQILCQGSTDGTYGVARFSHPEVGTCEEEEAVAAFSVEGRARWNACFQAQSKWQPTWARRVRYLDLNIGDCHLTDIPVALKESRDGWWLWWVPLPHIGGRPYGSFWGSVHLDAEKCMVAERGWRG